MRIDEITQDLNEASEAKQLAAVQRNGRALRDINNPSEKVQIAAVKQNGFVIQFIKNPSEAVRLSAVKQVGYAIKYIDNPSMNLLTACKREIITAILTAIRDENMNDASDLLQKIQNTGWPEVAIIKKSLAAIERNK
jgi:hypothetical protein